MSFRCIFIPKNIAKYTRKNSLRLTKVAISKYSLRKKLKRIGIAVVYTYVLVSFASLWQFFSENRDCLKLAYLVILIQVILKEPVHAVEA